MSKRKPSLRQRFQISFGLRVGGAALLIGAFVRATVALDKTRNSITIIDAAVPVICVIAAVLALMIDGALSRSGRSRRGRDRSSAVRQLHRELDAVPDGRTDPRQVPAARVGDAKHRL